MNSEIYPYWPYSFLVAAFLVFLLTDMLHYTPVILLESIAYLSTRILLIWGTSVNVMRLMQVAYGIATATEIAYFAYIYTVVPDVYYKQGTSCVRAARLAGQAFAGGLGQALISTNAFNTLQLNYISLASVSLSCVIAIILTLADLLNCLTTTCAARNTLKWFYGEIKKRKDDLIGFYKQPSVIKWSAWWAFATCGIFQVSW